MKATEDLVRTFRTGEDREGSFRELFERYHPQVLRFFTRKGISPEDGRDLTQEVFVSVHEGLGGLRDEQLFERWLFKIALNMFRNQLDRSHAAKRAAIEVSLDSFSGESSEPDPAEVTLDKEKQARVHEALEMLPTQMRRCVQFRAVEDLSYQEIASIMGLSQNTVKAHLYQARKILREKLEPFFREVDV